MDRRVFFDEPHMQDFLSSLDEPNRQFLEEAAERECAHLPLFPACLKDGESAFDFVTDIKGPGLEKQGISSY